MSFFDDGEETAPRPSRQSSRSRPAAAAPRRPRAGAPRRSAGPLPRDQHTLMIRRRVAAGVGVVLLIAIVLIVNGCLKSEKQTALKEYNRNVSTLAQESNEQVSGPLFTQLSGATGKSALSVEEQIDQLRIQAQDLASHVQGLSVPGEMDGAQRDLELTFDLRAEGLNKIATLVPSALGGHGEAASSQIAGAMEIFLASDVLYSQRVVPLIQQTLTSAGIQGLTTAASRFLPNVGWLEASTVYSRITGQAAGAQNGSFTPGNHGSELKGVSVGSNALEAEPALNHINAGANPTFTVMVTDSGEFPETNVKVDLTVTAAGKALKVSHVIDRTEPGKTVNVEIPVTGVPFAVASKVVANIEGVPGENDLENNKGTYLAIFGQ